MGPPVPSGTSGTCGDVHGPLGTSWSFGGWCLRRGWEEEEDDDEELEQEQEEGAKGRGMRNKRMRKRDMRWRRRMRRGGGWDPRLGPQSAIRDDPGIPGRLSTRRSCWRNTPGQKNIQEIPNILRKKHHPPPPQNPLKTGPRTLPGVHPGQVFTADRFFVLPTPDTALQRLNIETCTKNRTSDPRWLFAMVVLPFFAPTS